MRAPSHAPRCLGPGVTVPCVHGLARSPRLPAPCLPALSLQGSHPQSWHRNSGCRIGADVFPVSNRLSLRAVHSKTGEGRVLQGSIGHRQHSFPASSSPYEEREINQNALRKEKQNSDGLYGRLR